MTTPRARAHPSIAATLVLMLALGACVGGPPRSTPREPAPVAERAPVVLFDNGGREHVHVYLIGQRREWLLGRVEPGAVATLRLPDASLAADPEFVRLAVVTGGRVTHQAARDPRARLTMAQPASAILSQRWKFAQGELTSPVPRADRAQASP